MTNEDKNLKQRIINEMGVNYTNSLEKNFDLAKQFIRVTQDGKIDVIVKDELKGEDQISLYLIGKLYAKEANFSKDGSAGNKELAEELGIPMGSLLPWLKNLRDGSKINPTSKGYHAIKVNLVEKTLKEIQKKVEDNK